jgi:class 3 adenylate cyclase
MKGIAEWLASIGLSEYAQRFAENAIDLSVVRDLTEQDLKDLGVLLGHRRKILRAIAELGGVAPAATETATEPVSRDDAERRHLTVMICDLVGSTAREERGGIGRPSVFAVLRLMNGSRAPTILAHYPTGRIA